jgi:hypothetical protein
MNEIVRLRRNENLAEREGFEPSLGQRPKPDFESGAIDHSATAPRDECLLLQGGGLYGAPQNPASAFAEQVPILNH